MQSLKTIGTKLVYIIRVKNDQVDNVEKVTKINPTIMSNPHAHPHTMRENTCKVSKQLVQNCKRTWAHKRYPLSI